MFPEFGWFGRQDRLGDVNHLAHERFRLWTEREIDAPLCSEQVRNDGITTPLHPREQQRRPAFADDATMNLRQLEVGIDLGVNGDDFVFSGE